MSAEKIAQFRERATPGEKCGRCSHPLGDHTGVPCMVPVVVDGEQKTCPCPAGVRTDVFMCQQLSKIQQQNDRVLQGLMSIDRTMHKLYLMTGEKYGLEVEDMPDGGFAIKRKLTLP